jgi:hypothetical protein
MALFIMIGFPLFFLLITLVTGRWGYFLWSLAPSFIAGWTGYYAARRNGVNEQKTEKPR